MVPVSKVLDYWAKEACRAHILARTERPSSMTETRLKVLIDREWRNYEHKKIALRAVTKFGGGHEYIKRTR